LISIVNSDIFIAMNNLSRGLKSQSFVLFSVPETNFSLQLNEAMQLYENTPAIETSIIADQDSYAKRKKAMRVQDKAWMNRHQPALIDTFVCEVKPETLELCAGRPRMHPIVAYVFLWVRGTFGSSLKDSAVRSMLQESATFTIFLMNRGINLPGASTVVDQINLISTQTRKVIYKAQLDQIIKEKLDDFNAYTIDSTSVEGNSEHPVESTMMSCLVTRIFHLGSNLDKFGIKNMHERNFPNLIKKMQAISKKVALDSGKKGSPSRRKSYYNDLINKATSAKRKFGLEMLKIDDQVACVDILPSQKEQLLHLVAYIKNDIEDLQKVIDSSTRRVLKKETVKSTDKVLSLSDPSVACIIKGSREAIFGYKPQLGRSQNGFVSSLIVPEGNASDSGQLNAMIEQHISNTQVQPKIISTDDGYANTAARDDWLKKGVEVFSISGSKGKRLTPEEDWDSEIYRETRNNRSAVESLMFCIKFSFNFGRSMRRGIENVRNEMMEKVLAYNFARMVKIRRRQLLTA